MAAKKDSRFVLIGAHLNRSDADGVEGVTVFEAEPVVLSAVTFERGRGAADPEIVRRALKARAELVRKETFIAIRYGLTVSGDAEAREKCAPHLKRWHEVLRQRRGMVELTLRVAAGEKKQRPDRNAFASGAEYLRALGAARTENLNGEARRQFEDAFKPFAVESRWLTRGDGGSELVILLRREDFDRARRSGEELQRSLPATPFLLSGPWPLETFADDEG